MKTKDGIDVYIAMRVYDIVGTRIRASVVLEMKDSGNSIRIGRDFGNLS